VDLRTFLTARGITLAGAGVLAGVAESTMSRICSGQVQARPQTIVRLAKALGVRATRIKAMCDASYLAAHPDEALIA
jgi:transcriptional regulator with XRE-family HTH domain